MVNINPIFNIILTLFISLQQMALYLSQHVDENDVQTISHKCEVLSLDEYKQYVSAKKSLNTMVKASDIYYLAGTYDPGSGHTVSAN